MTGELLQGFPVIVEFPIAWGEMDSFQHVNNILFFRYFENARFEYFTRVGLVDLLHKEQIGPIMSETQCKFIKPLVFPDTVSVGARVTHYNPERFVHEYVIVSHKLQKVAAVGTGTVVAYDYRAGKKSAFPDWIKSAIEKLEGCPAGS